MASDAPSDEELLQENDDQIYNIKKKIAFDNEQSLLWKRSALFAILLNFVIQIFIISFTATNSLGNIDFINTNWKNFFTLILTISSVIFGVAGLIGVFVYHIIFVQFHAVCVTVNCTLHIVMMVALENYFYIALIDMISEIIVLFCLWKIFKHLKGSEPENEIKKRYIQCMQKHKFCNVCNGRKFAMFTLGFKTAATVGFILLIMNAR